MHSVAQLVRALIMSHVRGSYSILFSAGNGEVTGSSPVGVPWLFL